MEEECVHAIFEADACALGRVPQACMSAFYGALGIVGEISVSTILRLPFAFYRVNE